MSPATRKDADAIHQSDISIPGRCRPVCSKRTVLIAVFSAMLLAWPVGVDIARGEEAPTQQQLEFFEKKVRPLLAQHCYECHSVKSKKIQAELVVDSRAGLLRGGDSGAAIVPGDVDASLLIEAVRYESNEMPPKGKLPASDIATLEQWVGMGAPWPREAAPTSITDREVFDLEQRKSDFWVWQPVRSDSPPTVKNTAWPRSDLDRYILTRLEEADLSPADDTDRTALMRRLYFDLIGLPPSVEQVKEFLANRETDAVETVVDELLDSPHFGERWGRHWLDLVRYAESRGHEFDNDSVNAYQYRDYVIRAFNADVPHDQLVREHIAGDLLAEPRLHPELGFNESMLGTGFWFLGEWVHSPVDIRKDEADRFDNMLDVMSKTFLGVTVACARCHDHKFDAISTADYYSLSGFLQSSDYRQVRFESIEPNRRVAAELADMDAKYQQAIGQQLAESNVKLMEVAPLTDEAASSIVFDYATLSAEEFRQDGFIFGSEPRRIGQPYLDSTQTNPTIRFSTGGAVSDSIWNGLESISEKGIQNKSKLAKLPRSGRTLRTPTFEVTSGDVACRVRGTGDVVACVDSHRLIAGPLHGQTIKPIKTTDEWVTLDLRRYIGHRLHLEFTPAKDVPLEVSLVTQGASDEVRKQLALHQAAIADAVNQYAEFATTVLASESDDLAQSWSDERVKLQSQIVKRSHTAMAMMDGSGEDDHILIRGNASKPGDVSPRHFLTAVKGDEAMRIESGSGRLELAQEINDPENPLTSRVLVNRVWHSLMGRGIVPTTDDFGYLGQRPSHPELLDHLATRFVKDGRSIKRMIRYIVLSRTYEMSSHSDPRALAADPKNMLWHHRPPKRLEGEVIRDALLAISGRLDKTQFGEPVPIHLTDFMDGRGRPGTSGPLDGDGRRSIYIAVRRNFLSPFMLTFDTPVPFSTMGRRNSSNVPAQALILMNDPLVVEQSRKWAERALKVSTSGDALKERIEWMYVSAFARLPTDREQQVASRYLKSQSSARGVELDDSEIWSDIAHALVNTKEFIFLR